jgi:hypothetical protein
MNVMTNGVKHDGSETCDCTVEFASLYRSHKPEHEPVNWFMKISPCLAVTFWTMFKICQDDVILMLCFVRLGYCRGYCNLENVISKHSLKI